MFFSTASASKMSGVFLAPGHKPQPCLSAACNWPATASAQNSFLNFIFDSGHPVPSGMSKTRPASSNDTNTWVLL